VNKIPTLFKRGGAEVDHIVIPELTEGCEWVLQDNPEGGQVHLTIKVDGLCVQVKKDKDGTPKLYRRLKPASGDSPAAFVPCNRDDPNDALLFKCCDNCEFSAQMEGIYEAYGPGVLGNAQGSMSNGMVKIAPADGMLLVPQSSTLIRHRDGVQVFYDTIKRELEQSEVEGVVFHLEKPSMHPIRFAKIKRRDFKFSWPIVKS
jgi:hypothetical protein